VPKFYVSTGDIQKVVINAPDPIEAVVRCIKRYTEKHGKVALGVVAMVNERGDSDEAKLKGSVVVVAKVMNRLGPEYNWRIR